MAERISKLLATFKDTVHYRMPEEYQERYDAYLHGLFRFRLNVLYVFAFLLYPLGYLFDLLVYPQIANQLILPRLLCSGLAIVMAVAGNTTILQHYNVTMFYAIFTSAAGFIIYFISLVGGVSSGYYAGLNMVFLCVAMIAPIGFVHAAVSGYGTILAYLIFIVAPEKNIPYQLLWNNMYFMSFTATMVAVSAGISDANRKKQFMEDTRAQETERNRNILLENKNKEITQLSEQKKDFIANITHDLKSPLSIVVGYSMMLENDLPPDSETREFAHFITNSSSQLNRLIDKLVSIALLEGHEDVPHLDIYDYAATLRTYFYMFQETAVKNSISFTCNTPDEKIVTQVDITWVERIIGNLLQNAFKFTNPGDSISLRVFTDHEAVWTEIADTGIGIASEKMEKIFERKYQADDLRKHQGFGLGLSIVKESLEKMGGTIEVSSLLGGGSTFRFSLPLYADQNAPVNNTPFDGDDRRAKPRRSGLPDRRLKIDRRTAERMKSFADDVSRDFHNRAISIDLSAFENKDPSKPTILIVDDTPAQVYFLLETLKVEYNLLFATNGKQGLKQLSTHGGSIALILSDVQMPEMNGIDFCRAVFSQMAFEHIPFIFITAYANESQELQGLQLGATDYLSKPVNQLALKEKIAHWIARREHEMMLKNLSETYETRARELDRLRAIVEHELGHPLSMLSGADYYYQQLYEHYYLHATPEQRDLWDKLKTIRTGVDSIEHILKISDKLTNSSSAYYAAVDTHALITDAIEQCQHLLQPRHITLDYSPALKPISLNGDYQMLLQVIKNLVRNAVEAIVETGIDTGRITLSTSMPVAHKAAIAVADNGIGMTEEALTRLFQFKYSTKATGTGIGLYTSQLIIKMHGGHIDATSTPGHGTIFTVSLPIHTQPAEHHLPHREHYEQTNTH